MDPLSAIGLSSSLLTFVDFAAKIIKGLYKVYVDGDQRGQHEHLGKAALDLEAIVRNVRGNFDGDTKDEKALHDLTQECKQLAQKLGTLLKKLEPSKGSKRAAVKSVWSGLKYADEIRSLDENLSRYRQACLLRLQFVICNRQSVIASNLDQIQSQGLKLSKETAQEVRELRRTMESFLHRQRVTFDSTYLVKDPWSGGPPTASGPPVILNQKDVHPGGDEVVSPDNAVDIDKFNATCIFLQSKLRLLSRENRLLSHLMFESMYAREDSIRDAEFNTFDWMLTDPVREEDHLDTWNNRRIGLNTKTPSRNWQSTYSVETYLPRRNAQTRQRPGVSFAKLAWSTDGARVAPGAPPRCQYIEEPHTDDIARSQARRNFRHWLAHGNGVFHISGRPGTGKSTLMKFLSSHMMTIQDLTKWAGEKRLILAKFFFYNSGDQLQMSLDGFYRSVLFEALRSCPQLIPQIFPEQWKALEASAGPEALALERLQYRPKLIVAGFQALIQHHYFSHRLCIFIDGLDECQGDSEDHFSLARDIQRWSQSGDVKLCVSSRPYNEFMHVFSRASCHQIHLHDITRPDIYVFSREALENCPELQRICPGTQYLDLVSDIVERSDGVFLWARLVVRILLRSIRRYDSFQRLRDMIMTTPRDLNTLYGSIINSVDPVDHFRRDQMLLVTALNPFPTALNAMIYAWLDDIERPNFLENNTSYTNTQIRETHDVIRSQITSLTNSMLEVISVFDTNEAEGVLFFSKRVQCFHRTAIDYIREKSMVDQLSLNSPHLRTIESFAKLRLAELVLSDPNQLICIQDSYPNQLLDELFAPRVQKLSHLYTESIISPNTMGSFEQLVEREEPQYLLGEPRPLFYGSCYDTAVSSYCLHVYNRMSFIHYACFHGHTQYVLSQVSNRNKETVEERGLNLLLSALLGGHLEMVRHLLYSGWSVDQEIEIRRRGEDSSTSWTERSVPVWVLYLLWLFDQAISRKDLDSRHWTALDLVFADGTKLNYFVVLQDGITKNLSVEQLQMGLRVKGGAVKSENGEKQMTNIMSNLRLEEVRQVSKQNGPKSNDETLNLDFGPHARIVGVFWDTRTGWRGLDQIQYPVF